jgi:amino acid adenylation domain-containing protein
MADSVNRSMEGAAGSNALSPAAQRLLERRRRGLNAVWQEGITRLDPRRERVPLSAQQQRLYFLDRLESGSTEYLMPTAWRFNGPLDEAALDAALTDLVRKHEQLRTSFHTDDGVPCQRLLPVPADVLDVVDLTAQTLATQAAVHHAVTAAASAPFDLAAGAAFRATLIRIGTAERILVLNMHHIVCDAWSFGLLIRDLQHLYLERLAGRVTGVDARALQYADYVVWQHSPDRSADQKRDLDYWRMALSGLAELELPTDRPRGDHRTYEGATYTLTIDKSLSAALLKLGAQADATPFMTLLGAFQAALGFHCGQDDIAVGTVTANRDLPDIEAIVGFFVNTMVMRADLSGDPTPLQLLAQVREHTLGALSHQALSFERVVDICAPERDLSRNPLFQVLFAYAESDDEPEFVLGEVCGEPMQLDLTTAKFDLSLHAELHADGRFSLYFNYRPDLFDERTIARLADHTRAVLGAFAEAPHTPISRRELLTENERAWLLAHAERAGAASPGSAPSAPETAAYRSVLERLEEQVRLRPDAIAVSCADRSLTYAALDAASRTLARRLRGLGVGPMSLVGVCVSPSERIPIAVLAIWRAGGAYLPLDPSYPRKRLEFTVDDAEVDLVIADERGAATMQGLAVKMVTLGDLLHTEADASQAAARTPPMEPERLAYVIYTSGSTGRPKGVEVTHGNLAWLFGSADRHFDFSPADVWTMAHSHAFDFSVWELWGPLTSGGRVIVLTVDEARDPAAMHGVLAREHVTVLNQTPTAFKGLRTCLDQNGLRYDDLALRTVILGGDAFDIGDYREWFAAVAAGDRRPDLVNMYGITETTVHVTHRVISADDVLAPVRSPIGAPLAGQRCYVLDRHGRQVPVGTIGELYVAGGGVSRGYRRRSELTAERFPADRFAPSTSGEATRRMYRTGDLVRMLPSGELAFLGRVDRQVKIRGFRIEPAEIESALCGCPGVADAAVVAVPGPSGDARVVAHLVLERQKAGSLSLGRTTGEGEADAGFDRAALRLRLRETLPEHMIPALFVGHERLPVTANGKVDRAALVALTPEASGVSRRHTPASTPVERLLAGIWAEVLEDTGPGIEDSFFDLGGDSILALRVTGLARAAGLALSVADIFRDRTIAALAARVEGAGRLVPADASVPAAFAQIEPSDRRLLPDDVIDAYPLTMLQTGMVHEMYADTERRAYHNVTALRITVPGFDLAVFQAGMDALIRHHDILRTSFDLASYSVPLQLVHRAAVLPIGHTDLRDMNADEQQAELARYVAGQAADPFDLSHAPLLRIYLHRLDAQELRITLTDCHIVLDGWSLTSLIADLVQAHALMLEGREPALPAAPLFAEYVRLERAALESQESLGYWRETLSRLQPVRFIHRASAGSAEGDTGQSAHEVTRDFPALSGALGELAQRAGVPLRTVSLAAFYHVMGLFATKEQRGVPHAIGMVTNGRPEEPGADEMRGLFLNTVVFGVPVADGPRTPDTWLGLLQRTFAAEQELMPHRRFPLVRLQQDQHGDGPLAQAVFNYVNFHRLPRRSWDGAIEVANSSFPLACNATPSGFTLEADASFFDAATVRQMADLMYSVLEAMLAHPSGASARPRLSGAARRDSVERWANGPCADNTRLQLHEFVHEFAVTSPHTPAVEHRAWNEGAEEITVLTYAQLDQQADLLADRLRGIGLGPGAESIVGICLDRGPGLVRAVLAVLKTGAAFLPLDPRYPADRLAFMAADSAMTMMITEPALVGTVPYFGPVVMLDGSMAMPQAARADRQPEAGERSPIPGEGLAYVIYTSGSTGTPKGTMVTHRGMTNLIEAQREVLRPTTDDRVLQLASFSFDIFVYELTWALANGGTLCTAPHDALRPGPQLARTLLEGEVTAAVLPPTALSFMAGVSLPGLATLISGGEDCSPEIAAVWSAERDFMNGYGLTETSVWSNIARVEADDARPPIGRPIRNSRVYVLDDDLEPVPVGMPGEIYVGGEVLARGYLGRPALTAASFVADPYGPPGGRLFRTGDLGRHRTDGALEFLGRRDTQVKLRGQRLELGEVESVLREHPEVRDAVVLLRTDLPGESRLVAYLVPEAAVWPTADSVRTWLRGRLPAYMVPPHYVILDAFPLTGNDKVDRKALPLPSLHRSGSAAEYTAPRTTLEVVLAAVIGEVLGLAEVGVLDDFFDLGGSSLSTVRVAAKAAAHGVRITVRDLIEAPRIADLAQRAQRIPAGGRAERTTDGTLPAVLSEVRLRGADPGEVRSEPLYCIHPTGGSAAWYIPLARALPPTRPVAGFQARGLLGGADPLSVPEIGSNYAAEIAAHGRRGPFALLGWSMGGDIAVEAARALSAQGLHTDPLILIEPYLPNLASQLRLASFVTNMEDAMRLRDRLRDLPSGDPEAAPTAERLQAVLIGAGLAHEEADLAADAPIEVWHNLLAAISDYRLEPYSGPVHLVIGEQAAATPVGEAMTGLDVDLDTYVERWRAAAGGGLTIHWLPGDHRSMLAEPLVANLSSLVERLIAGDPRE